MSITATNILSATQAVLNRRRRRASPQPDGIERLEPRQNGTNVRLWGLSPLELHDAYWKSRGVQCLRLGQARQLEAADLYLLLGTRQATYFHLDALLGRLIWQGACMTVVQLVTEASGYHESAITDSDGNIKRIERSYGAAPKPCGRVFLTDRAEIAMKWMRAGSVPAWRRSVASTFPQPLVARTTVSGRLFADDDQQQVAQLLTLLVEKWPDPERVLDGLEALQNGVRMRRGSSLPPIPIVGPAWIGSRCGAPTDDPACIVGPAWSADQGPQTHPVRVRSLHELEMPQRSATRQSRHRVRWPTMYPIAKRIFDITVSATALLVSLPVLAAVAAAIVIDDGFPVLFRHRRQTLNGRLFHCLKFRTMHRDAESMVVDLSARNLCDGPQVHIEDDPRVTRIGRLLRKSHLDELPQLCNVLAGEMSLVGPRPSPDAENRICPAWRELRLSVRPGITGLWQVNRTRQPGRDFQEWIRYDVEYVQRAGFWLDVRICIQTALMMLTGRKSK